MSTHKLAGSGQVEHQKEGSSGPKRPISNADTHTDLIPESCPNCGSPRVMISDGRAFFKCGMFTGGLNGRYTCRAREVVAYVPKPRYIFANGSCRVEITGPDGTVYEFSGIPKGPVGFGGAK